MLVVVLCLTVVSANAFVCEVDNVLQRYDTETHVCCSGLHLKYQNGTGLQCCSGNILYDSGIHICCGSAIYKRLDSGLCCNETMHYMEDTNKQNMLVCCGKQVFFQGTGICCAGQFTRSPNKTTRMECLDGKGVIKRERHLQMIKVNGVQMRELNLQGGRRAKTCQNDIILDSYLPQGSEVKSDMLVLDGVNQCGQIVYPIESSTFRYHCCNDEFYKTDHIDPKADYSWECCGKNLYNTSSHECCAGELIDTSLRPIGCCNGALVYTKSYQRCCGGEVVNKKEYVCHKPVKSSLGKPVRKQADDHNATCYDHETKTMKTFNNAKWICYKGKLIAPDTNTKDNYLLKEIQEVIVKQNRHNHTVKKLRDSSPMCPYTECDTGVYNRSRECRKRIRVDFFLHNTTKHNGSLVLSGIITYPPKVYGAQFTIKSFIACQENCFATGILYSIYTNRLTGPLPSKGARLSIRDIVVKTHTDSMFCTIDPWPKRTEKRQ